MIVVSALDLTYVIMHYPHKRRTLFRILTVFLQKSNSLSSNLHCREDIVQS